MNVKSLIEVLKLMPPDTEVVVCMADDCETGEDNQMHGTIRYSSDCFIDTGTEECPEEALVIMAG